MKKVTFTASLLLPPIAYAIHHFEEHILFNFREWRLLYFPDSNPLSTELVFMILTTITLLYIFLHHVFENRATAQSILLFLMASQVHNIIFHAGGTVFFWNFSPGLYTAILLYLPVNIYIVLKAFQENWLSRRSLIIVFLLGGVLFWSFEKLGPLPMIVFLVGTYLWIAVETKKTGSIKAKRVSSSD